MNSETQSNQVISRVRTAINSRITYRMIFILASSLSIIGTVIFLLILRFSNDLEVSQKQALANKGKWLCTSMSEKARIGVMVGRTSFLEQVADVMLQDPEVTYVIFYNQKGDPIYYRFNDDFDEFDLDEPGKVDGQQSPKEPLPPKSAEQLAQEIESVIDLPPLPETTGQKTREIESISGIKIMDVVSPIKTGSPKGPSSPADEPAPGSEAKPVLGWARIGISAEKINQMIDSLRNIIFILILLFFVLLVITTAFLHRMIAKPIMDMADAAKMIGKGNLDIKLEVSSDDEVGALALAFNEMTRNISGQIEQTNNLMDNMAQIIELITRTTDDIYAISAQQSSGATEQAASVYEVSSTSKEIAASATRIADSSDEVSNYARQASSASDQGREELKRANNQVKDVTDKVEQVATRMLELGEKSQKITGIIEIINEISKQTNLLSLNAAIEAAGAGEAGRRFSVVAQEIRRLANRTLDATQLVRELVEEIQSATNTTVMFTEQSMKSTKEAMKIIEAMNQSFEHILGLVDQTLKASTQISLSTRQQTTACDQMAGTIMEVSDVASQVEEGAKETEAALSKLRELSADLKAVAQSGLSNK